MKTRAVVLMVWMAGCALALGQSDSTAMPPPGEGLGPNPMAPHVISQSAAAGSSSTLPSSFLPPEAGADGNSSTDGNSTATGFDGIGGNATVTAPSDTLNLGPMTPGLLAPGPLTSGPMTPGPMAGGSNTLPPPPGMDISTGNATAPKAPQPGTGSAGMTMAGSGMSSPEITMPTSMDMIDNTHKLATGDRFYYQVLEDRDPPRPMIVNEKGLVNVPYLGARPVAGKTLREMAYALQKELENSLYIHATVLAVPDNADHSHNQIYVLGAVGHQGPVNVPPDDVLTVWSALWSAGGLAPQADATRVSVMRPDSAGKSPSKMEVNVQNIIDKGTGDVVVQPGDIILVPPKGEASGYVTVTGDVRGPGMIGLPAGSNTTVSWVILQAGGFTEWADEEEVEVVHYDEQGKRHDHTVNIGAVLNKGQREKDTTVQAGDMIIVPQDWVKF